MDENEGGLDAKPEKRLVNVPLVRVGSSDDEDGRLAYERGGILTDVPDDRPGFDGRHFRVILHSWSPGLWKPVARMLWLLLRGIESDHFRVKRPLPRVGCFQAFHTARCTIQGFEAMLWPRKGFGFAGTWTVLEQNRLLALCFGLPEVNKV